MDSPWLKFYDQGVPAELNYPQGMVTPDILERAAGKFPNRPALLFPSAVSEQFLSLRLTYRDLNLAANRFANALIQLGVQKGDRVGLLLPNSPPFVIAFLGALKAGAIGVALDPAGAPTELEYQLNDCGAETVVVATSLYPTLKKLQANTRVTRVITTNIQEYLHPVAGALSTLARESKQGGRVNVDPRDYSFKLMLQRAPEARPSVEVRPDDAAIIQYRSCTAGTRLGVLLTHRSLVANTLQLAAWRTDAVPGHEAALCLVPFYELYGLLAGLLHNLYLGAALILFAQPDVAHALRALDTYHPTFLPGTPALFAGLVNTRDVHRHNLQSLRLCLSGTAPLPPEVQTAFQMVSGARVVEAYGLGECGALTHIQPIKGARRAGSIGLPVPGTHARIVDPANPNVELPPEAVGQLAVQGPQVLLGYWGRPQETARTLRDGWVLTGAYARMDSDGFFYLVEPKTAKI